MTTNTTRRSEDEIRIELHALNALLTDPVILAHDADRDDLHVLESLCTQIRVIRERLSYPALLAAYEDGSEDVCGAAYDAWRWLHEGGPARSDEWDGVLETLASVAA